jgi:hypothetical protein
MAHSICTRESNASCQRNQCDGPAWSLLHRKYLSSYGNYSSALPESVVAGRSSDHCESRRRTLWDSKRCLLRDWEGSFRIPEMLFRL